MKKLAVYVHGKGGSAAEAAHYESLLPDHDVIGYDYRAENPWQAKEEFSPYFHELARQYDEILLIANSIGAYFSMSALTEEKISRALLISPVVDMESLIGGMMLGAGVDEPTLRERGEIATDFGETLSWGYLCYVRAHPIHWSVPTDILYGEHDVLTAPDTIRAFAERTGARLTVMPGGEHWFHTDEQMAFLDRWLKDSLDT